MAHVNFDGLTLRLTLTAMEKAATLRRGDVVVPRAALAGVRAVADIWDEMQHGITPLGVGHKGMIFMGTALTPRRKDFAILGKPGPGLVIELREWEYDQILLSLPPKELWALFTRLREVTAPAA
ncbi:MAG: hypothetical protein ACOYEV_14610 [Candidatus Nanopelagicales bacterium]